MPDYYGFQTEEDELKRQQALIDALRKTPQAEGLGEVGGWTSAVTGTRMPGQQLKNPIIGQLAPLIGKIGADYRQQGQNAARTDLTQREQEKLIEWLTGKPKGKEAVAAVPGQEATLGAYGVEMPATEGTPAQPAVPPSQQELMAWAARGQAIPGTGQQLSNELLKDVAITQPAAQEKQKMDMLKWLAENGDKQARLALDQQRARDQAAHWSAQDAAAAQKSKDEGKPQPIQNGAALVWPDGSVTAALGPKMDTTTRKIINEHTNNALAADRMAAMLEGNNILKMIEQTTGSAVGAKYDQLLNTFGKTTDGAKAIAALNVMVGDLILSAQTTLKGPTSNNDLLFLQRIKGNLDNPDVPVPQKLAAYRQMKEHFAQSARTSRNEAQGFKDAFEEEKKEFEKAYPKRTKAPAGGSSSGGGTKSSGGGSKGWTIEVDED